MKTNRIRLYKFVIMALFLITWEAAAKFGPFSEMLFPGLATIGRRFWGLLLEEALLFKTLYSIAVVWLAMLLSLAAVVVLLTLSRASLFVKTAVDLIRAFAAPVPGVAILPLVILWFGLSRTSMLLIMIHATLWPLWTQLSLAVDRLSQRFSRFERAYRLSHWKRFWHLYCLGAAEDLKSALGVAWSRGWRALISVEMIFGITGSQSGLGWLLYERRMYMDTAGLYAGLAAIALCGILFETWIFRPEKAGEVT